MKTTLEQSYLTYKNERLKESCLHLAKRIIEDKLKVIVRDIKFEDGSGKKYIFNAVGDDPTNYIYIQL